VAMRQSGSKEFVEAKVPNEPEAIRRFTKKVVRKAPGEVRMAYEGGCCGYALQRQIEAAGPAVCDIVASTLIPRKPGDRVKTDRRDARKLCELLEAGLLTTVKPPTPSRRPFATWFGPTGYDAGADVGSNPTDRDAQSQVGSGPDGPGEDASAICSPPCGTGEVCCTDQHGHFPGCVAGDSCS
jgi:hypothetical protein